MTNGIKKIKPRLIRLAIVAIVCLGVAVLLVSLARPNVVREVDDFDSCVLASERVLETYPEQCVYEGRTYTNPSQSLDDDW